MHHYRRYATAAFAAVALTCAQAQQHHFAVEDSIAMQRFTDPTLIRGACHFGFSGRTSLRGSHLARLAQRGSDRVDDLVIRRWLS